jgi:hypothetical protein
MRKDMAKVIVERPRGGSVKRARKGRTRALEDEDGAPLKARAVTKKPARTKYLNENLAPLRRFLEGQVGRPWDKVYAEIAEHLKPTSTVQQHVLDHVDDFVATKTKLVDGEVFVAGTRAFRGPPIAPLKGSYTRLYVHPKTGLLLKNPHWRTWAGARKAKAAAEVKARAARMREISPLVQLHLLGDVWWEVKLAKVKHHTRKVVYPNGREGRETYAEQFLDVVRDRGLSKLSPEDLYARPGVYGAQKRQLNKAEKKRLGLA